MDGSLHEKELRRRLAVQRVLEGWPKRTVAGVLGVSLRSVQRWLRSFRDGGPEALASKGASGRPSKLTAEQEEVVLGWILQPATNLGFVNELWTAPRIARLIRKTFGIQFHPRYLNQWLTQRRITSQKPQRKSREQDIEKIRRWLRYDWPRIRRKMRKSGAHLLLIDESGLMLLPLVRRTLAPQGQTPVLKVKGSHRDRVSLIAGLTVSPEKQHVALYFRAYPKQSINNVRTSEFLRQVLNQVRGTVIVICDRGAMHKGPAIRQLIKRSPRLSIEYLPPYAPELNPVESVWNYTKYDELANYSPQDVTELERTAHKVLDRTKADQKRLDSFWKATPFVNLEHRATLLS